MRKIMLVGFISVVLASSVCAQSNSSCEKICKCNSEKEFIDREKAIYKSRENLFKRIELSKAQKEKMERLQQLAQTRVDSIKRDKNLLAEDRKKALQALRKDLLRKRMDLLTVGQRAQMQELLEIEQEKRMEKAQRLVIERGKLSAEQKAALAEIEARYKEQEKAIIQNAFSSKDAKQKEIQALQQEKNQQIRALLFKKSIVRETSM